MLLATSRLQSLLPFSYHLSAGLSLRQRLEVLLQGPSHVLGSLSVGSLPRWLVLEWYGEGSFDCPAPQIGS